MAIDVGFFAIDESQATPEWQQASPEDQLSQVVAWHHSANDKLAAAGVDDDTRKQAASVIAEKASKIATPLADRISARRALAIRDAEDEPVNVMEAVLRGQTPWGQQSRAIDQFRDSFHREFVERDQALGAIKSAHESGDIARAGALQAEFDKMQGVGVGKVAKDFLGALSGAVGLAIGKGPEDAERSAIRTAVASRIGKLTDEADIAEVFAKAREYRSKLDQGESLQSEPEKKTWKDVAISLLSPVTNLKPDRRQTLAEAEQYLQQLRELSPAAGVEAYRQALVQTIPFAKGEGIRVEDELDKDQLARRAALTDAIQDEIQKHSLIQTAQTTGSVLGTVVSAYGTGMASRLPGALARAAGATRTANVLDRVSLGALYGASQSYGDELNRGFLERSADIVAAGAPIGIAESVSDKFGDALVKQLQKVKMTPALRGLTFAAASASTELGSEVIEAGIRGSDILESAKQALLPSAALGAGLGFAKGHAVKQLVDRAKGVLDGTDIDYARVTAELERDDLTPGQRSLLEQEQATIEGFAHYTLKQQGEAHSAEKADAWAAAWGAVVQAGPEATRAKAEANAAAEDFYSGHESQAYKEAKATIASEETAPEQKAEAQAIVLKHDLAFNEIAKTHPNPAVRGKHDPALSETFAQENAAKKSAVEAVAQQAQEATAAGFPQTADALVDEATVLAGSLFQDSTTQAERPAPTAAQPTQAAEVEPIEISQNGTETAPTEENKPETSGVPSSAATPTSGSTTVPDDGRSAPQPIPTAGGTDAGAGVIAPQPEPIAPAPAAIAPSPDPAKQGTTIRLHPDLEATIKDAVAGKDLSIASYTTGIAQEFLARKKKGWGTGKTQAGTRKKFAEELAQLANGLASARAVAGTGDVSEEVLTRMADKLLADVREGKPLIKRGEGFFAFGVEAQRRLADVMRERGRENKAVETFTAEGVVGKGQERETDKPELSPEQVRTNKEALLEQNTQLADQLLGAQVDEESLRLSEETGVDHETMQRMLWVAISKQLSSDPKVKERLKQANFGAALRHIAGLSASGGALSKDLQQIYDKYETDLADSALTAIAKLKERRSSTEGDAAGNRVSGVARVSGSGEGESTIAEQLADAFFSPASAGRAAESVAVPDRAGLALQSVVENDTLPETLRMVAGKLQALVADVPVVSNPDLAAAGKFSRGVIEINPQFSTEEVAQTLVHESSHAALAGKIGIFLDGGEGLSEVEMNALTDLQTLFEHVRDQSLSDPEMASFIEAGTTRFLDDYVPDDTRAAAYGLSGDINEFIAEVMANGQFQGYLSRFSADGLPLITDRKLGRSLWQRFKDMVKRLFGIEDNDVGEAAMSAALDLLQGDVLPGQGEFLSVPAYATRSKYAAQLPLDVAKLVPSLYDKRTLSEERVFALDYIEINGGPAEAVRQAEIELKDGTIDDVTFGSVAFYAEEMSRTAATARRAGNPTGEDLEAAEEFDRISAEIATKLVGAGTAAAQQLAMRRWQIEHQVAVLARRYVENATEYVKEKTKDKPLQKALRAAVTGKKVVGARAMVDHLTNLLKRALPVGVEEVEVQELFAFFEETAGTKDGTREVLRPGVRRAGNESAPRNWREEVRKRVVRAVSAQIAGQLRAKAGLTSTKFLFDEINSQLGSVVRAAIGSNLDALLPEVESEEETNNERRTRLRDEAAAKMRAAVENAELAESAFNSVVEALRTRYAEADAEVQRLMETDPRLTPKPTFDLARAKMITAGLAKFLKLREEIYKPASQRRITVQDLVNTLVNGQKMPPEQARKIASSLERAYNEAVSRGVRREIEQISGKQGSEKIAILSNAEKYLRLSNLGVFNDRDWYEAVAPVFQLPGWNAETAKKLADEAEAVQALPAGSLQFNEAAARFMLNVRRAEADGSVGLTKRWRYATQIFNAMWVSNVLSGVKTSLVNIYNTLFSVNAELAAQAAGSAVYVQKLLKDGKITQKEARRAQRELFVDILRAYGISTGMIFNEPSLRANHNRIAQEIRASISKGTSVFRSSRQEEMGTLEQFDWDGVKQRAEKAAEQFQKGDTRAILTTGKTLVAGTGSLLKFVGRSLLAQDSANQNVARAGAALMGSRIAALEGGNPEYKPIDEYEQALPAAQSQLDYEVANNLLADDKLAKQRRLAQLIEQTVIPEGVRDASDLFAQRATLNDDLRGAPGAFMGLVQWATNIPVAGALVKWSVPFPRIMGSIVSQWADWSPIGLRHAENQSLLGLSDWNRFDQFRHPSIEKDSAQYYALKVKGWTGTGVMMLLLGYLFSEWSDRDEDRIPWFDISGSGPDDPVLRKNLLANGWTPQSIVVGNTRIKHVDLPIGLNFAFGAIGKAMDQIRWGDRKVNTAELALQIGFGVMQGAADKSFLQGLRSIFTIFTSGERGSKEAVKFASSVIAGYYPFSGLIRFGTDVAVSTTPEFDTLSMVERSTPFAYLHGHPALNVFGREVETTWSQATFNRIIETREPDPVLTPLLQAGLKVPVPDPKVVRLPGKVELTPDQQYVYKRVFGQRMEELLTPEAVKRATDIANQDPERAQKYLSNTLGEAAGRWAKYRVIQGEKP